MKYIVLEHVRNDVVVSTGVIFTRNLVHKDVAAGIQRQLAFAEGVMARVVSAGFVVGKTCSGRSESLNIGSRGEVDARVLEL